MSKLHVVESFKDKRMRDIVYEYLMSSGIPLAKDWCKATEDLYITCDHAIWCKYSHSTEHVTHCIRDFIQGYMKGANRKYLSIVQSMDYKKSIALAERLSNL